MRTKWIFVHKSSDEVLSSTTGIMDHLYDDYHALWRNSAQEKHPYTEDFPEALLVLPELIDGALSHGKATDVWIQITLDPIRGTLRIKDLGRGLWNETRFLSWAASSSLNPSHRNGHGHKKAMTKIAPDFKTADWQVRYRKVGGNLITLRGPFLGSRTPKTESDDDQTTLMPSGTETEIKFDPASVLERFADPMRLQAGLKELIQTRYSESALEAVAFHITINYTNEAGETKCLRSDSRAENWHSFRWHVENGVLDGYIREYRDDEEHESRGASWKLSIFEIIPKGSQSFALKKEFPTYGQKNEECQRAYISLKQPGGWYRMIEAVHLYHFLNRKRDNHDNGFIVFVDFTSDELTKQPQPSTTKISMYPNDEIYKQFTADLKECLKTMKVRPGGESSPPSSPDSVAPRTRERIKLVEDELGVTFCIRSGQIFVDFNDGRGLKPVRDYKLTRRDEPTQSTA